MLSRNASTGLAMTGIPKGICWYVISVFVFYHFVRAVLIPRQDEWIKHGLTRRECELELAIQVPAGSETSTTAIRGIMLHLLSSPNAYQKLQDEITTGIQEGRISSPITNDEAKQLPYLQVSPHAIRHGSNSTAILTVQTGRYL
jgi:hypothetical protein